MGRFIESLYERILGEVIYRGELGQHWLAAIIAVGSFVGTIVIIGATLWGILALFGTKVYFALAIAGAVWYAKVKIAEQFPQDESENETGVE